MHINVFANQENLESKQFQKGLFNLIIFTWWPLRDFGFIKKKCKQASKYYTLNYYVNWKFVLTRCVPKMLFTTCK